MPKRVVLLVVVLISVYLFASRGQVSSPPQGKDSRRWYKGNTHTHTLNSDGDSTSDDVVRWYREHGYQFLVLTDHNFLTSVDGLNALHGADEQFRVIKGEELTDQFGEKPIHINGLNIRERVSPQGGSSVLETVQRDVDAIRGVQGVPHINHPNFHWAITSDELKQVKNTKLFEIFNGHPQVNNLGGGGAPGLEEMWDAILSSEKLLYGIAVDDAHHFKRPWDATASRPGQGWVVVRAEKLSAESVLAALEQGDFYASTGVELEDYKASQKAISLKIRALSSAKYRVQFIGRDNSSGKGGKLLKEEISNPATYEIRGGEGYVRAKVIDSNGKFAWTQPVLLR